MKLHKLLITAIICHGVAASASAQHLSPSEISAIILNASPATRADSLGIATLTASLKTESNLPDPEIEGEYLFATGNEKNRWGAVVTWGIEWPGVYSARKKDAAARLSAAEASASQSRQERLIDIKRLLLDYVLAEKQLALLGEIKSANDSIMTLSEKAGAQGELTRLDLNKLRLEQATLHRELSEATNSRTDAMMKLGALYGGDCSMLLKEMACEFPEITVPEDVDYRLSPSVRTAEAEAVATQGALRVADAESYPGLSIGYQHAYEDGANFNGASIGISIPVFSQRGKKAAAKAALAEAEFKAEKALADAKAAAEGAERKLLRVCRQIEEMSPVVNDPDNTRLLMKAYQGGLITLIDYLNERKYFTNATLEFLTLRHAAANLLLDIELYI